jgi:hypothetical protein
MECHKGRILEWLGWLDQAHASELESVWNSSHAHCRSRPSRCATAACGVRKPVHAARRYW